MTYGLVGLKTHCKTTMVVREEEGGLRRYCHMGTGNYNASTAKTYEDVGLFTCDEAIGTDLTQLFNFLTGYSRKVTYQRLLVAPHTLRQGLVDLVANEVEAAREGRGGSITIKVNSLVDAAFIDALCDASQEGVEIDLIVRGICCLRPGVPGRSERIRVRSLIGRYLEHSRIYHFANGGGPGVPATYLGSADLMPRNLDHRVEILLPVTAPDCLARLDEVLLLALADEELAWVLDADGTWTPVASGAVPSGNGSAKALPNSHLALQDIARGRTRRREIEDA